MRPFLDPFLILIVLSVAMAYSFPNWTVDLSGQILDQVASVGIALIFFFYGIKLNPNKIKSDLGNWKLHLLVQCITFLLFPLLIIPFQAFLTSTPLDQIWLGFLFLAVLPSTVSSSVVMVSMARGNIAAAIFNASISGLIGIFLTPLWFGVFVAKSDIAYDLSQIYMRLITGILLPVVAGLFFHRFLGSWANRYKNTLSWFDKSIILLIIFKSFGRSFESELFASVSVFQMVGIGLGVVILFILVFLLSGWVSKKFQFSIEDQITAQFCGTKKSLVHGSVFVKILLPASTPLGLILLPIMLYHALQLFVISYFATQFAKR